MAAWIRADKIRPVQNIIEGFENMPAALIGLYTGTNVGKQVVKVHDEPGE
jgi:NADPH-dependent curcumin reductase CurA